MSAETFVYGTLTSAAGVTALVGSGAAARVYPDEAKEGEPLPLIVYDQGVTEYHYSLDNTLHAWRTTIAISCWAASRAVAEALADAVVAAMHAANETVASRDSDYDEANQAYAAVVTYGFWNK